MTSPKDIENSIVWGFQGVQDSLKGEEHRLQNRWPCVKSPDGRFFLVTDIHGKNEFMGHCEEQAEWGIIQINLPAEIPYNIGHTLDIAGSDYFRDLSLLTEYYPLLKPMVSGFVEIQDGFRVKLATLPECDRLRRIVVEAAKSFFDRSFITIGKTSSVTDTALRLLRGTYTPNLMDYSMRELVSRKMSGDERSFSDLIVLVADGQKIPEEDLKLMIDVWMYAADLRRRT